MNSVFLIGNIAADLELRTVNGAQGETSVCNFPLAVDNANGEKDKPGYFDITAWGKGAEALVQYQSKGSRVAVEGQLRQRVYDDNEGKKVYRVEVGNARVTFLGSPKNANSSSAAELASTEAPAASAPTDDDIPF